MSYNNLIRWSAVALIVAGILIVIDWVLGAASTATRSELSIAVGFSGTILFVFGLMGIYGCQIQESGMAGFIGFILAIISNCFTLGQNWLPESGQMVGIAGVLGPLIGITGVPGYILLAVGTWRGGRLPRWSALLWSIGYTLSFISMLIYIAGVEMFDYLVTLGILIWTVGFIWAGTGMLSLRNETAVIPETVS